MPKATAPSPTATRIDKWLWAARFFKTRSLAAAAVKGGKVLVNGGRAKPSRMLKTGEKLLIRRGDFQFDITIDVIVDKRVSAKQASELYTETQASIRQREDRLEALRIERKSRVNYGGRPDKKDRRELRRLQSKAGD